MRSLIILIAIGIVVMIAWNFIKQSPQKYSAFTKQFGLILFIGVILFLLATGRMPWLLGLAAAAIPFIRKMAPLLRYVPFLHGIYRQHTVNKAGPSTGQHSNVMAKYIDMQLDHDSGEMDGKILQGQHQGSSLSQLSLEQLLNLFPLWQDDSDSVALLQAYLDRMHSDWRQSATGSAYTGDDDVDSNRQTLHDNEMNQEEALQILGLEANTSKEEIIAAHKRLMQKVHPDRGGSNYLAAKINAAKTYLLKHLAT